MTAIPSGLPGLDEALGGGLPHGVVLVHGEHASPVFAHLFGAGHHDLNPVSPLLATVSTLMGLPEEDIFLVNGVAFPDEGFGEETLASVRDRVISRIRPACLMVRVVRPKKAGFPFGLARPVDVVLCAVAPREWVVEKAPRQGPRRRFDPWHRPVTPERVISALRKNPEVAWAVAGGLVVLAPWRPSPHAGSEGSFVRVDPAGTARAILYPQGGDPANPFAFKLCDAQGREQHRFDLPTALVGDALQHADMLLRMEGVVLLDEEPPA